MGTAGMGVLRRYERRPVAEPAAAAGVVPVPADAWGAICASLGVPADTPAGQVAAQVAALVVTARIGGRRR